MQQFILTLKVTINTVETVSAAEVEREFRDLMEDSDYGPVEVLETKEI